MDLFPIFYSQDCVTVRKLYPFSFVNLSNFSWRAIASQQIMLMSGFAGHIDCWLAIASHKKMDKWEKLNGYNFLTVTQSCEHGIVIICAVESSTILVYSVLPYYTIPHPQDCVTLRKLYPFSFFNLSIFSWRAIASQQIVLMSGFAGHIDSWLAIARHKISKKWRGQMDIIFLPWHSPVNEV